MGVLEQITQMKSQGIPEEEIVRKLQEQGVTPKAITDAISQSKIKNAVSDTAPSDQMQPSITNQTPSPAGYSPQTQEMQAQETYAPQAQDYSQQALPQQTSPQQGYSQQEYYPQEGQEAYGYSGGGGMATDTDTMIEISEQVFSEKIKKIQRQVDDLTEFKTLAQTKLDSAVDRLKRVEATIDKLQIAILDKIGSYGKNLESMKKEMSMMQDSFGKMVGKAVEKTSRTQIMPVKATPKKTTKKKTSGKKK